MKAFDQKLAAFDEATGEELHDNEYDWMVDAVETQDTIDDFKAARSEWNEKGVFRGKGEIAGLPFVTWTRCQARKGQSRRDVSVLDFGDRRIVLDADLTVF